MGERVVTGGASSGCSICAPKITLLFRPFRTESIYFDWESPFTEQLVVLCVKSVSESMDVAIYLTSEDFDFND